MFLHEFNNLAELFTYEFKSRKLKNKKFSLRAFALFLNMNPSQLSLILKGEKGISLTKAHSVAKILEYNDLKTNWFIALVQKDFARSKVERMKANDLFINLGNRLQFNRIDIKNVGFKFSWLHSAVRTLTTLENFKFNEKWIAKKLNIKVSEAKKIMGDLLRSQMIIKDHNDKYVLNNFAKFYWSGKDSKKNMLETSIELEKVFFEKHSKNQNSLIYDTFHFFTIDSKQIPNINALINKFNEELEKLIIENPKRDKLVCMKIGAYKLNE